MRTKPPPRRRTLVATAFAALVATALLVGAPAAQANQNPTLEIDYDAVGTTHIGAQVDSSMAIGPSVLESTLDLTNGHIVGGSLAIPAQTMNFDIFGIPAQAKVTMTQVGPLTGAIVPTDQLGKSRLSSTVAYDIKLSDVKAKVFGVWWPLAVGSRCHTAEPVDITASTPEGEFFTVNGGGRVTSTYTIGSFTGCAALNFFDIPGFFPWFGSIPINALVPGTDNTLELQIANPRAGTA
ncbi:hypothetical protein [Nocardioides panzhihuensis]|uniref:Uncharacterized protein n=1 Tax=Nocardioides panzhihuensis TaxID=860243 RepID=A0A7Z0DNK7_9ACTN|nr:hypothetical protein [Nocardioides panzhihuensis]NYI78803.1 hypothetical protein [Nocardioides panzhihuensis]